MTDWERMINWDRLKQTLCEISAHFDECVRNSAPGSEVEQTFRGYMGGLFMMELIVDSKIEEERRDTAAAGSATGGGREVSGDG